MWYDYHHPRLTFHEYCVRLSLYCYSVSISFLSLLFPSKVGIAYVYPPLWLKSCVSFLLARVSFSHFCLMRNVVRSHPFVNLSALIGCKAMRFVRGFKSVIIIILFLLFPGCLMIFWLVSRISYCVVSCSWESVFVSIFNFFVEKCWKVAFCYIFCSAK